MATKVETKRGRITEVIHEPGNMARYRIVAAEYRKGHWMVSVPEFKVCLEMIEGSCVHYGYVREKLKITSDIDASEIAKAVAAAVPGCEAEGVTDDKGKRIRK